MSVEKRLSEAERRAARIAVPCRTTLLIPDDPTAIDLANRLNVRLMELPGVPCRTVQDEVRRLIADPLALNLANGLARRLSELEVRRWSLRND